MSTDSINNNESSIISSKDTAYLQKNDLIFSKNYSMNETYNLMEKYIIFYFSFIIYLFII